MYGIEKRNLKKKSWISDNLIWNIILSTSDSKDKTFSSRVIVPRDFFEINDLYDVIPVLKFPKDSYRIVIIIITVLKTDFYIVTWSLYSKRLNYKNIKTYHQFNNF